ncbi:major facilitator superfamily transporter [Ophiocordyceps camponoti-floridani]|uniref:Major facilitator superfamily transporter n=1 Tax=Ophiocordyceps camponoti-floridani TaxID=2030778 RepID=A0A8H4Q6Y1_9HYPO|nr:major facilitator superfamily transporter [Ophiocordyceps camponoti-floridani]
MLQDGGSDTTSTKMMSDSNASELGTEGRRAWASQGMKPWREALLVFTACMAQFCTQTAFFSTLILLRPIGASFGIDSPARLAWLVAAFSLAAGTLIIFCGRLGDVFGHGRMLILGFTWWALWSAISGLSVYSTFYLSVISRAMQGVGPAVTLPNALAVLGTAYPPGHRKAMVFAMFGAVAPVGAVVGGVFSTAVIGIVALVLFSFAWTQAPVDGWSAPSVLVPLVAGLALFGLFLYTETKLSPAPLVPLQALTADVGFVLAAVLFGWASFGVWTLYLVQTLQEARGLSPLMLTAYFCPVALSGATAAVATGLMLGPLRLGPPTVMTVALAAFTIGSILTAVAPVHQTYWAQLFVAFLVMPVGMDCSFPASTLVVSNAVARRHQGVGASLVSTVVNYGIALGVGFAGTAEMYVRGDPDTVEGRLRGRRIPPFVESVERVSPDVTFLAAHAYALKQAIDETIFLVKETDKLNMRETQEILVALESVKIEGHRGTEALGKPRDRIKELKLCGFMRTQIYQLQYKFRWLIPHLLDKFPKAAKGVGGTVRITLERFLEDWAKAYTLYNCKNDLYDTA